MTLETSTWCKRDLNDIVAPLELEELDKQLEAKHYVIDLLSFCVRQHGHRIKNFILEKRIASKIMQLSSQEDKYIQLDTIRFLRAFLGTKDNFFYKHCILHKLFQPVMEIFQQNINNYNLINSTVCEIFDFLLKQNNSTLIIHLVQNYRQVFEGIEYVDTFKRILKRYEALLNKDFPETAEEKAATLPTPKLDPKFKREIEKEREEHWFDSDDSDSAEDPISDNLKGKPSKSRLKRYDSLNSLITNHHLFPLEKEAEAEADEAFKFGDFENQDANDFVYEKKEDNNKLTFSFGNGNQIFQNSNPQESPKKHKLEEQEEPELSPKLKKSRISTEEDTK